jgi:DNA-directed RNA polymerase subunit alpha
MPVEANKAEKLPIGMIALDAIFTPIVTANFSVENMRVGDRTDYNRLKIAIVTDGSITPSMALRRAAEILKDHHAKLTDLEVRPNPAIPEKKAKKGKK